MILLEISKRTLCPWWPAKFTLHGADISIPDTLFSLILLCNFGLHGYAHPALRTYTLTPIKSGDALSEDIKAAKVNYIAKIMYETDESLLIECDTTHDLSRDFSRPLSSSSACSGCSHSGCGNYNSAGGRNYCGKIMVENYCWAKSAASHTWSDPAHESRDSMPHTWIVSSLGRWKIKNSTLKFGTPQLAIAVEVKATATFPEVSLAGPRTSADVNTVPIWFTASIWQLRAWFYGFIEALYNQTWVYKYIFCKHIDIKFKYSWFECPHLRSELVNFHIYISHWAACGWWGSRVHLYVWCYGVMDGLFDEYMQHAINRAARSY